MRAAAVLLCLAVLRPAAVTWAAPPPAPPAPGQAAALPLATEGQRLYEAERYAEALDRFQQARRLYPSPDLLVYIAAAQVSLGREADAVRSLLAFFPEAATSKPALRALALELWRQAPQHVRQDAIGPAGADLPQQVRARLAASLPYLPPELAALAAAAPAQQDLRGWREAPGHPAQAPSRYRVLVPALVLGGLGLVGLGTGAALVAIEGSCATAGTIDTCERVYHTSPGGYALLALGGAALVGGGAWLAYGLLHRPPPRVALGIGPSGTGGGGLVVSGRF